MRVGEEGVTLAVHGQAGDVHGHEGFQGGGRVVADQPHLAHVGDIEERGRLAAPLVLGEDARGVLHRHVVAGKGHHAGAELHVQGV